MTIRLRHSIPALVPAALLAGCVAQGPFPSLEPREGELAVSTEEPVRTPPVVPSDPALLAQAAELVALARAGEREFEAVYPEAAAAAQAAGEEGSESWVIAQEWLSALEAARVETMRALGALDQLALARAAEPTAESDFAAVLAALEEAEEIAAAQETRLDRLRALIRS